MNVIQVGMRMLITLHVQSPYLDNVFDDFISSLAWLKSIQVILRWSKHLSHRLNIDQSIHSLPNYWTITKKNCLRAQIPTTTTTKNQFCTATADDNGIHIFVKWIDVLRQIVVVFSKTNDSVDYNNNGRIVDYDQIVLTLFTRSTRHKTSPPPFSLSLNLTHLITRTCTTISVLIVALIYTISRYHQLKIWT